MLRWLLLFVSLLHVGCKRPATSDDGDVLATLQSFLLFVGYQRSGSTLVASVLDQHPNIVITHEYDVLRHWKSLEQAPELFLRQLLKQAQHDAKKKQLLFNGYNFSCQPQLSGTYNDQLLVLGDKKAGHTAEQFAELGPQLALERLQRFESLYAPLRFVHCIRNPFDIVATKAIRASPDDAFRRQFVQQHDSAVDAARHRAAPTSAQLRVDERQQLQLVDEFIQQHTAVRWLAEMRPMHHVHAEQLIANAPAQLAELCRFLSVYVPASWLRSCAKLVSPRYTASRHMITWHDAAKTKLREFIASSDLLQHYVF